jgi:murein DD-endopeptidase MepM/ murein hydrolase activator NlpD
MLHHMTREHMTRARRIALILLIVGWALIGDGSAGAASAYPAATNDHATQAAEAADSGVRYSLPLPGAPVVVRPFAPPPTPYAAGHRGVDLASTGGANVTAAAAGTVTFAGSVAGRGVVVIAHPDGVSTEYEPVDPSVQRGELTSRGEVIGHVAGTHDGCAPDSCLHWGARRDGTYFDPMSLLRPLGTVRLIPWS